MFIEVWSDILCPFCYIGKRNLENALKEFPEPVQVVWRSFELDPKAPKVSPVDLPTRLAERYGQTLEWAREKNREVEGRASSVGLTFHLEKAVLTNSFDAHRLIHLAESKGQQNAMKERLLAAYFTESKNIGDLATLVDLAVEIGLDGPTVEAMLKSDQYSEDVRNDERLARDLDISGVPFFVVNQRFAISGAQPKEYFLEALHKIKEEMSKDDTRDSSDDKGDKS
jgi:predicted DsbA family dithiol-disulfide isomerase